MNRGGASGPGDIDQNLLLQFSCMNTTDRDELISQMQRLLGPSVNTNSAKFFLSMSNWNLQTAIGYYFDYTIPPKIPSMSVQVAHTHDAALRPGARFEQSWEIANTGAEAWPPKCVLMQVGGDSFRASAMYLPALPAGHRTKITLRLVAPATTGTYRGFFHLLTEKGHKFGDTLWVEIEVESEMTMALVEQLAALPVPSNNCQNASQDDQMC